jgi:hypothetical protein
MCIAPALAGWSEGAFSAHPPLAKRLAHLGYPLTPDEKSRFDEYDPSVMPRYSAEVNEELGIMQFHRPTRAAEVKRNPPRADGHRLAPPEATAQARSFTLDEALNAEPDLDSAVLLLAELPQPLREALRTEEGARAAAHALLNGKVQTYGELARRYSIFLAAQGDVWRLPLFELAAPALRAMSSVSRQALATELHGVVHAYGTMTMHELVFYLLLTKLLDTAPRKTSIQPAEDAAATVLAAAAYEFAPDPAQTQAAFDAGVRQTPYALKLPARAEVTTASLELALDRLSQIADLAKPHITRGVAAVVCHDGEINAREIEFVRAVGAALDCPIPPLAITKIKPPKAPA